MEKILLKMARQLLAYDEASLLNLWEKYADQVSRFEPTKRWEEAVMVLCMIQSMRFKNQLFNLHWSQGQSPGEQAPRTHIEAVPQPGSKPRPPKPKGKLLSFPAREEGDGGDDGEPGAR